jgi:hypothetical protein
MFISILIKHKNNISNGITRRNTPFDPYSIGLYSAVLVILQ